MTLLTLFLEFFKIGLFCFGGAFGMIPLIKDTVLQQGWLSETQFYDFIGVCESTPGPIAVNMATYVGSTQAGLAGSVCATAGVVTPSFLIILLIASVLKNFHQNRFFKAFLKGVKPVIIALILSTGVILLGKILGYSGQSFHPDWIQVCIFSLLCITFFGMNHLFKKKLSSIGLIGLSAVLGIAVSLLAEILG